MAKNLYIIYKYIIYYKKSQKKPHWDENPNITYINNVLITR